MNSPDNTFEKLPVAKVVRQLDIEGIESVHGVTFDGHSVWFAHGDSDSIAAVDPDSGAVRDRIEGVPARSGTCFDGSHLWQIGSNRIARVDPKTHEIVRDIPLPEGIHASGMAWADGILFVGDYVNKKIHKIDSNSGALLATISSDRLVTGITWVDGELWHAGFTEEVNADGDRGCEIRRVDPDSGEVVAAARTDGWLCAGLEADNAGQMWCGGGSDGTITAIEKPAI